MLRARLTGFDASLARLATAVDDACERALYRAAEITAETARDTHTFQNRTGDLEASIRAIDVFGSALAGTAVGGVVADEPYGEYVEERLPFLAPAWDASEATAERETEDLLADAARASGW